MEIVITSPSFSRHPILRNEIKMLGHAVKFNETGSRPSGEELSEFIGHAEILVVSLEKINHSVLSN